MENASARNVERLWREPEFQAAALNGALILIVPGVWSAYLDYCRCFFSQRPCDCQPIAAEHAKR